MEKVTNINKKTNIALTKHDEKNSSASTVVYINTLGEFSIRIKDKIIRDTNNQAKKPWIILQYLITFRKRSISSYDLIDLIWASESSANPQGALKTLLFRSRQLLLPLDFPPQLLIIQKLGSYAWNPSIETVVDIDLFEEAANKALAAKPDSSQALDLCLDALDYYKGDFLPRSSYESWVVPISTYYHSLYQQVIYRSLDLLNAAEDYPKIIEICQKATAIEAYDEEIHFHLIRALYLSGNQKAAIEHYTRTTDMFYNQFAITPSERFKSLYKMIRDQKHGVTTDLGIIQDRLREETSKSGAYYCEYSVFRDIYQLEARSIERTGDSIYLCLISVSDKQGDFLKTSFLIKAMNELGEAICISLRRGDVYTRYSVSQYLFLLPTASFENAELVMKRIIRNFKKQYSRKDLSLQYSLHAVTNG